MKKWLSYGILCVLVPAVVVGGAMLFDGKQYAWISLCVVALSCVPFFLSFEKGKSTAKELILIAVMTALSVVGRIVFAAVPGFKPVTAMVVITAMYFGSEAGFVTGALSAVISNFYFGQGPWTPFQMFVWGIVGLLAGIFAKKLRKSRVNLVVFGAFSGVIFSLLMDIWTVLWADGNLNFTRYIAAITSSAPFTAIYAVSNIVFLIILAKPIGKILERIKMKYAIGDTYEKTEDKNNID
ncbi:MAG: ECF transporter S component [Faecalibacterium sp.]|nr:ECF transporter S component [Ruminococcus sp.]MCM1392947.1 ECF transporter S component [Ruminococcus sp.]MCM1486611.1 ECF transporter S component [Faecalibacterium sp.]